MTTNEDSLRTLLIEQTEDGRVDVTANTDELDVPRALFMLKLAELSLMSYFLSEGEEPQDEDI